MADTGNDSDHRRRGRPRSSDQDKINIVVFFARLRDEMTADLGRAPTDTEMFQRVLATGGYEHLVAGDWTKIREAQSKANVDRKVARLQQGTGAVRSKAIIYEKTLRNFYAIAKHEEATDPDFRWLVKDILEQYRIGKAPPREISGHCSGWMPPLKHHVAI
jgi:hypothetical protein